MGSVVISSAGSGKTTWITGKAVSENSEVLVTTFTVANSEKIRERIVERVGVIPQRITVLPWFSFLLRDAVRPYQSYVTQSRIGTGSTEVKTSSSSFGLGSDWALFRWLSTTTLIAATSSDLTTNTPSCSVAFALRDIVGG